MRSGGEREGEDVAHEVLYDVGHDDTAHDGDVGCHHGPRTSRGRALPQDGHTPPTVVCESPVVASQLIGWSNGTCWIFHPVSVTDF